MNKIWEALNTLAHESGGGVNLETIAGQRIKGIALFLEDGRVAVLPLEVPR